MKNMEWKCKRKADVSLIVFFFLILLCTMASWYWGVHEMKGLEGISARADTALFSGALLSEKAEGEKTVMDYAIWETGEEKAEGNEGSIIELESREDGSQSSYVREPGTGRAVEVQMIWCQGNMAVINSWRYIAGGPLTYHDGEGCVLSEKTAVQLFQSTAGILGMPVEAGGRRYYVRGITKESYPVIYLGTEDEEQLFHNLELIFKNQENGWKQTGNFPDELGIYDGVLIIDGSFAAGIGRMMAGLPIGILVLAVSKACAGRVRRAMKRCDLSAALVSAMVFTAGVLLFFAIVPVKIPDSMLPPKWSDFEFYELLLQDIKAQIQSLSRLAPSLKQLRIRSCLIKSVSASSIAVALEITGFIKITIVK